MPSVSSQSLQEAALASVLLIPSEPAVLEVKDCGGVAGLNQRSQTPVLAPHKREEVAHRHRSCHILFNLHTLNDPRNKAQC